MITQQTLHLSIQPVITGHLLCTGIAYHPSMSVAGALPSVIHQIRRWIFTAVTSRERKLIISPKGGKGRITHIISGSSHISGKLPPDNRMAFPRAHPHTPHTQQELSEIKKDLASHIPTARTVKLSPRCPQSPKLNLWSLK